MKLQEMDEGGNDLFPVPSHAIITLFRWSCVIIIIIVGNNNN